MMIVRQTSQLVTKTVLGPGLALVIGIGVLLGGCQDGLPFDEEPPSDGTGLVSGQYVGADRCRICHTRIHDNWQDTSHAGALETLEAIGQGDNEQCLLCHTVGYGEDGGFVDQATTDALAGVQCENCHGPGLDHVSNVSEESLRPPKNMSGEVCGVCHTDAHHPTHDEWSESRHSRVDDHVAERFAEGNMGSCAVCHSGDARLVAIINGETIEEDMLEGVAQEDMNAVTCAVCHDPHRRTDNAAAPEDGKDYQLRYVQVAYPTPSDVSDDATNPDRFNLCGQCHHSRGKDWQTTSRPPHHSHQSNVYMGEMPIPDGTDSLVDNDRSIHAFAAKQCTTCHMGQEDYVSEEEPAVTGHLFHIDMTACSAVGCHPSTAIASADMATLQTEVQDRLDDIYARLGDPATWEYESNDGPDEAGQALLSDEIKQIRFLYYYTLNDTSLGVHNPQYVKAMLDKAEDLLDDEGL